MVMSAHSIFSITICISSLIQHLPGVFFQQVKQPRQGLIFNLATLSVSTFSDCFSSASRYPAKKALVSLRVLLRSSLGLPFMTRIFIFHPPAFLSAGYNLLSNQFAAASFACQNQKSSAKTARSFYQGSFLDMC